MSGRKSTRVIFDTNIWISFLIGKRLRILKNLIATHQITIVLSEQLLQELQLVAQRPKLRKRFSEPKVEELLDFLTIIGEVYQPSQGNLLSRDPKDNFLLDLAEVSKADFLVTGDKDLLVLNPFQRTQIITPADFESEMGKVSRE